MYKVAIIDDEPVIVRGLTRSIDWKKFNCVVIGSAGDGQEGMKLIREKQPDILFSDISMPGLDGLSMIAAMKSEYGHMQITILTGFRDFDFAQQAIRLGVTRFLLKPSRMDELEEAITAMIMNLKKQGLTDDTPRNPGSRDSNGVSDMKIFEQEDGQDSDGHVQAGSSRLEGIEKAHQGAVHQVKGLKIPCDDGQETELNSPANNFIVKNAIAYIEGNYREKLKLSDVADQIYVSQWHLSKLLNKQTGQSFSDILNNVRIEKAKVLLTEPSLRIGDIAEEVGFLDMAHFSRVFKKQEGISANEYRNTVLGK